MATKTSTPSKPSSKVQPLSHHRLRVYWLALELAKLTARWPIRRAALRRQAERAVDSIALNIAEAAGLSGRRNKSQFMIARGSTLEVVAAYELAWTYGETVPVDDVRRLGRVVAAMLTKLAR
jgi:four helix bundle protein